MRERDRLILDNDCPSAADGGAKTRVPVSVMTPEYVRASTLVYFFADFFADIDVDLAPLCEAARMPLCPEVTCM